MQRGMTAWCAILTLLAVGAGASPVSDVQSVLKRSGFPVGSGVRSAIVKDGVLRVDFTPETARGLTDRSLQEMADAVRGAWQSAEGIHSTELTAAGRRLSSYLPPVPAVAPQPYTPPTEAPAAGPLTGKVITISPGHGWYFNGSWLLQRSYYYGIVEDFMNQEIMQYVFNFLVNAGATVYPTREMDKTYGDCETLYTFGGLNRTKPNKPWWQMAALYYTARMGAPSSVYDNGRTTDYNRDIAARPLYSNWRNADINVSLHNNAFNGSARGTVTLYDNSNGYTLKDKDGNTGNQVGSQYLAQKVNARVVSRIRSFYQSSWYDRGAQGFAGDYGENRIATRPSALIEVAFFDNAADNAALRDDNFRLLVAKGIYEGICDYFRVTPTYPTAIQGMAGAWTAKPMPPVWSVKLGSPVLAPPSSAGGMVYAATDAGVVYGVSGRADTGYNPGAIVWRYPASTGIGSAIRARPTVFENGVYAVSTGGTMVALNRLTGALLWTASVPSAGNLTSSPAVTADGRVVIGSDDGRLYAFNRDTGASIGQFPAAGSLGPIQGTVAIPDNQHVWVTSSDGRIRRLTPDLETLLWESSAGAAIPSSPFVLTANNVVYFTADNRTLYALNASNGNTAPGWSAQGATFGAPIGTSPWADAASGLTVFGLNNHTISGASNAYGVVPSDFPLRPFGVKEFASTPVVVGGTIYIGGTDGKFYALKRATGASDPGDKWRVYDSASVLALPGPFAGAPCVTGTGTSDVVAAGNGNGTLYAFPL